MQYTRRLNMPGYVVDAETYEALQDRRPAYSAVTDHIEKPIERYPG